MRSLRLFALILVLSLLIAGCGSSLPVGCPPRCVSVNLTGRNLNGADLTGAQMDLRSLDGAILTGATMPDGSIYQPKQP